MNNDDFSDGSDSSDEDYVPGGGGTTTGDIPSEVDSDGDPEDPLSDAEGDTGTGKRRQKAQKKKSSKNGMKSKSDTSHVEGENNEVQPAKLPEQIEAERKKHADDLWAVFKSTTGVKKKTPEGPNGTVKGVVVTKEPAVRSQPEKVKITQFFDFAGEQVVVDTEIKADSTIAQQSLSNSTAASLATSNTLDGAGAPGTSVPKRKATGVAIVLGQLGKKSKLSVLEKSKLDWNKFKKNEKIEDELESYKKGKDGYLERQDFLERADLRQFEIEKEARAVERSKRLNNAP